MRKTSAILIVAFLISFEVLFANLVAADFFSGPVILPSITITIDGSISPFTELIKRNGNTYTLTGNALEYPIVIERSYVVFDGAGYNITVTTGDNPGLSVRSATHLNVVVKNVNIFSRNIYTFDFSCSNGLIENVNTNKDIRIRGDSNTITKSIMDVCIVSGSNNLIAKNNITDVLVGYYSYSNMFFKNNFLFTDYPDLIMESVWDNGSVDNYWSNYKVKYSNASEIGKTGIGDTPYVIERSWYSTKEFLNQTNVDYFPLFYSYDIQNDSIAFPTPNPTIEKIEPSNTVTVLVPILAVVAIISSGIVMLLFRRHRKTISQKNQRLKKKSIN
jgi:hypothetical protein